MKNDFGAIKDLKVFQFVEIFSVHLGTVHYCILELEKKAQAGRISISIVSTSGISIAEYPLQRKIGILLKKL